jgi:hypothetical protein
MGISVKITKRQLQRIIAEEKQKLTEEAVDPEEFLYGEVDAMQKATDSLRVQFNELEAQMQDVVARIPGNVFNRNRKALMLQIMEEAGEALDDLERHFAEAHSRMGGWNRL